MKISIDTKDGKFIDIDNIEVIRILEPGPDMILCKIDEVNEGVLVSFNDESHLIKGAKHV